MSDRTALLKEFEELIAAQAKATGWGAEVGVRHERLNEVRRTLLSELTDDNCQDAIPITSEQGN